MIPQTPEQWLHLLTERLDSRQSRLSILRDYLSGNPPLPEGAVNDETAYREFQLKSRTNFAELVVDAAAERMRIGGFQVGTDTNDDDAARAVWRRNMLEVGSAEIHRDMLAVGVSYAVVAPDRSVMVEAPEFCITDDDPRTKMPRAGVLVWRDAAEGLDYADLLLPTTVQRFTRRIPDAAGQFVAKGTFHDRLAGNFFSNSPIEYVRSWNAGRWEPLTDPVPHGFAEVPIVKFANREETGEFERHIDLLDRINWGLLQRLVITATQAWRQRAIKGELPTHDADGTEIDYGAVFSPGAGALWTLPDGVDIWESTQTDIAPILHAIKDDIQHLAAVTRTPMATFMPEGANQSAEGAAFAREGLVFKVEDRIARASASWDRLMRLVLDVDEVVTKWLPAERQSLAERADAATKAQDLPWRTRMETIWQFEGEEIDRMEVQRAADALNTMLTAPPIVTPAAAPVTAPTVLEVEDDNNDDRDDGQPG